MKNNDINIDELIADAKAIKDTAMANAKKALEEAFTPRLQNMISAKLQTEDDDEFANEPEDTDVEVKNDPVQTSDETSDKGEPITDPVLEPSATDIPATNEPAPVTTPTEEPVSNQAPTDDTVTDPVEDGTSDAAPVSEPATVQTPAPTSTTDTAQATTQVPAQTTATVQEPVSNDDATKITDDTDDDLELESIIKELNDDDFNPDEDAEPDPDHMDDTVDLDNDDLDDDLDETTISSDDDSDEINLDEINIDEILREYNEDNSDKDITQTSDDEKTKEICDENKRLKAQLAETEIKNQELATLLNEINLLNAKLLYVNKIFKNFSLDSKQKLNVIDNFDRTSTIRESKLVYVTLCESLKTANLLKAKTIDKLTEGIASRAIKSDAPEQKVIEESTIVPSHDNTLVDSEGMSRLMLLANIDKKK